MYQYPGERKVSVDENFIAEAKLISGRKQEKSTGLKTVLNYSFVAGLMQLIKEKIVNDEFADSELVDDYPLVMDAPFSNTDEGHITRICKELPQYCNQIIFLLGFCGCFSLFCQTHPGLHLYDCYFQVKLPDSYYVFRPETAEE